MYFGVLYSPSLRNEPTVCGESIGLLAIQDQGLYVIDGDGDMVTPLVNNKECAYVYVENGVSKCAIEKAYFKGEIDFRKPISCHLYPIRITKYKDYDAVNYDKSEICSSAVAQGEAKGVLVYKFLKEALERKYGENWYEQLDIIVKNKDKWA